jgi:ubiquinol-cytochrome c reductase cytochrome c subunit
VRRGRSLLTAAAFTAALGVPALAAAPPERAPDARAMEDGRLSAARQLYLTGCSSCHGASGEGTAQGPSLLRSGGAAAYYYLATGRMPLTDPAQQPDRKESPYTPEQIALLVEYVASLGDGPPVPDVDLAAGDLSRGGVLYRANCAPCHTASAIGGALSYGRAAPSLHHADPLVVASAMLVGPGQMPVFRPPIFDEDEVASIVRYVTYLEDPASPGGLPIGGAGPVPEGFVAWAVGIGGLMLATLWIGTRMRNP